MGRGPVRFDEGFKRLLQLFEFLSWLQILDSTLQMHNPACGSVFVERMDAINEVYLDIIRTSLFVELGKRKVGHAKHAERVVYFSRVDEFCAYEISGPKSLSDPETIDIQYYSLTCSSMDKFHGAIRLYLHEGSK